LARYPQETISYCVKDIAGTVFGEGTIAATRQSVDEWIKELAGPWMAAIEATIFTGWVYDHLLPHGEVRVAALAGQDPQLVDRVSRLLTIPGIGPVTVLQLGAGGGRVEAVPSVKQVISYCGLCADEKSSAGVAKRGPVSKQRNQHLQTVLVEAAKRAPRWSPELARV
jgi:hypothetical protein